MGQVTVTLTGDEARLLRALDRVVAKEKEVGKAGKEAAKEHTDAFTQIEDKIQKLVTGFSPWAAAIAGIKLAYDQVAETVTNVSDAVKKLNEQGAQGVRGEGAALTQLSQLRDPKAFEDARRLKDQGGLSDSDAAQAVLGMRRVGLTGEASMQLAVTAARGGLGPDALTKAAAVVKGMGGTVDSTSVGALLGKAAHASPGNTGEFLEGMTRETGLARRLGVSEDELVALQSQAALVSSSPERGARGVHDLLENFSRHRVQGSSLADMVRKSQGVGGSEKSLSERFGGHGLEVLRSLNADDLESQARGQPLGTDQLYGALDTLKSDPAMAAFLRERDARSAESRGLEGRGVREVNRESRRTEFTNSMRAAGVPEAAIQRFMQHQDAVNSYSVLGGTPGRNNTFGNQAEIEARDEIAEGGYFGGGSATAHLARIAQNTDRRESLVNEKRDK